MMRARFALLALALLALSSTAHAEPRPLALHAPWLLAAPWTTPSGNATSLQGRAVSSTAPTSGYVLTWNGSAWAPAAAGGSGFTAGGDLTGTSTSQQVVKLSGSAGTVTVPSGVSIVPANGSTSALGTSGGLSSAFVNGYFQSLSLPNQTNLTYEGLTLGGGSSSAAGGYAQFGNGSTFPDARIQYTGTSTLTLDNSSSGAATLLVGGTGASQQLQLATVGLSVPGTGPANGTSAGLSFTTQTPNATNGSAGTFKLNTPAPTGTGLYGSLHVQSGGNDEAIIGSYGSVTGGSDSYAAIWFKQATPSTNNFSFLGSSGSTYLSAPSGGAVYITLAGSGSNGFALNANNQLSWASAQSTPTYTQGNTTNATATNLVFQPQQSTNANATGGNFVVSLQAPTGSGSEAYEQVQRGGSTLLSLGALSGNPTYGAVYPPSVTPNGSNESLATNGATTIINASTNVYLENNGSSILRATGSNVTMYQPVGGGSGVSAFAWISLSIALTSGSVNTLTGGQYYAPHLKFTGTLAGAGTSIVFPSTDGACWDLDFSAVSFGANTIALSANGQTWGSAVSSSAATQFPHVCYSAGVGRLVGVAMSQ